LLDYTQIEALLAVENEGSFVDAGKVLGMSAIGVARRIEKLEKRLGAKLLHRKPTRTSKAGAVLCNYAREIISRENLFVSEQRQQGLQPFEVSPSLKIAVDHHSLNCWFQKVLESHIGSNEGHSYDVMISDQDHSLDLMKSGKIIAAITSEKDPIHGFKSYHLGTMEFVPVASPLFKQRYFCDGVTAQTISLAPALRYDSNDALILQWTNNTFDDAVKLIAPRLPSTKAIINLKINLIAVVGIAVISSVATMTTAKLWDSVSVSDGSAVPQTLSSSSSPPPNLAGSVLKCGTDVYSPVQKRCVDQTTFDQEMTRLFAALGLDSKLYQTKGD